MVEHKDEKMYVPSLIFGHLLTSSNYNDEEEKVTGGRNGYGAKLCNIFSTKFKLETASSDEQKSFKQTWSNNMSKASEPLIKPHSGKEFTQITFNPDLAKFKVYCWCLYQLCALLNLSFYFSRWILLIAILLLYCLAEPSTLQLPHVVSKSTLTENCFPSRTSKIMLISAWRLVCFIVFLVKGIIIIIFHFIVTGARRWWW